MDVQAADLDCISCATFIAFQMNKDQSAFLVGKAAARCREVRESILFFGSLVI